jgi:hypothetical protein
MDRTVLVLSKRKLSGQRAAVASLSRGSRFPCTGPLLAAVMDRPVPRRFRKVEGADGFCVVGGSHLLVVGRLPPSAQIAMTLAGSPRLAPSAQKLLNLT